MSERLPTLLVTEAEVLEALRGGATEINCAVSDTLTIEGTPRLTTLSISAGMVSVRRLYRPLTIFASERAVVRVEHPEHEVTIYVRDSAIAIGSGAKLTIHAEGDALVSAFLHASVSAGGRTQVQLTGANGILSDSAHGKIIACRAAPSEVYVGGQAIVDAYGNLTTVYASGSATVTLYDSARCAGLLDSATVHLYDRAKVSDARDFTNVYLHDNGTSVAKAEPTVDIYDYRQVKNSSVASAS